MTEKELLIETIENMDPEEIANCVLKMSDSIVRWQKTSNSKSEKEK